MPAAPPALLLIAHGTREPRGAHEMDELVAVLRARHAGAVSHAWIEDFAEPDVATAMSALVAGGADHVVSVPLLNFAAGHAKTDIPERLAAVRSRRPRLTVSHARVLGLHPALFALARRRVDEVSAPEGRAGEALVVVASGSSDPDANSQLAGAARFLAEGTGHRRVEYAFAGVTWPHVDETLRRLAGEGTERVVLFSWSLLAGRLEQRVLRIAGRVARETGLAVIDAGRFGPDPLVADAVLDRCHEALHGDPRANCDLCAFRVPLPGLEDRVGAASPGGTGERAGAADASGVYHGATRSDPSPRRRAGPSARRARSRS
ncbi:MAG: sirohydrochlorin chelatase [Actinobacteria bacterium]|nr:sirohydrochlorin chelatase [Actinomycetota bacterium]